MEININLNNNVAYLTKPDQLTNNLNSAKNGLNIILDDYKKFYVLAKMYPENEEYQQQFSNVVDNIKQVLSNLFSLSNNVQVNINNISNDLNNINILIEEERKKNVKLKTKLGSVHHENNASNEMISDYKEKYDIRYLRNWGLGISALLGILAIHIVYKKQVV
jgi:hypothetical protein